MNKPIYLPYFMNLVSQDFAAFKEEDWITDLEKKIDSHFPGPDNVDDAEGDR